MAEQDVFEELAQLARRALQLTAVGTNRIELETLLDDFHELTPRILATSEDETDRRQPAIGVVEVGGDLLGTALASAWSAPGGWPTAVRAKRERLDRELRTLERARGKPRLDA